MVPISVIFISYWKILSYVYQVSQMSFEPPPDRGGWGGGEALPWNMQLLCGVSSGVYFMHHFNELHSSHLHVFFFQIHLTANRLLVLSISILFVAFFLDFYPHFVSVPHNVRGNRSGHRSELSFHTCSTTANHCPCRALIL